MFLQDDETPPEPMGNLFFIFKKNLILFTFCTNSVTAGPELWCIDNIKWGKIMAVCCSSASMVGRVFLLVCGSSEDDLTCEKGF